MFSNATDLFKKFVHFTFFQSNILTKNSKELRANIKW